MHNVQRAGIGQRQNEKWIIFVMNLHFNLTAEATIKNKKKILIKFVSSAKIWLQRQL